MHWKCRHRYIFLFTMRALFSLLAIKGAVCLLVTREIGRSRVVFAAFVACVPQPGFLGKAERILLSGPAIGQEKRVIGVGNGDSVLEVVGFGSGGSGWSGFASGADGRSIRGRRRRGRAADLRRPEVKTEESGLVTGVRVFCVNVLDLRGRGWSGGWWGRRGRVMHRPRGRVVQRGEERGSGRGHQLLQITCKMKTLYMTGQHREVKSFWTELQLSRIPCVNSIFCWNKQNDLCRRTLCQRKVGENKQNVEWLRQKFAQATQECLHTHHSPDALIRDAAQSGRVGMARPGGGVSDGPVQPGEASGQTHSRGPACVAPQRRTVLHRDEAGRAESTVQGETPEFAGPWDEVWSSVAPWHRCCCVFLSLVCSSEYLWLVQVFLDALAPQARVRFSSQGSQSGSARVHCPLPPLRSPRWPAACTSPFQFSSQEMTSAFCQFFAHTNELYIILGKVFSNISACCGVHQTAMNNGALRAPLLNKVTRAQINCTTDVKLSLRARFLE